MAFDSPQRVKSPGRTRLITRALSRSRERTTQPTTGHYDNAPMNESQLAPSPSGRNATRTPKRRGRPTKNAAMGDAVQNFKQSVSEVDTMSTITSNSGQSGSTLATRSDQSMIDTIRTAAPSNTSVGSVQNNSIHENSASEIDLQAVAQPVPGTPAAGDHPDQVALPQTQAPPRPVFRAKMSNFMRSSFNFFKKSNKNNQVTEILTTEDAGLDDTAEPIGYRIPGSNTVIVNEPIKARLARIAHVLGFTGCGLVLHCIIFMACFAIINFFMTFYFPIDDEEKISYFHSLMTRDNEINTLLGHYELNKEVWLRWPEAGPELLALGATILLSAVMAKIKGRAGDRNEGVRVPLVNLY